MSTGLARLTKAVEEVEIGVDRDDLVAALRERDRLDARIAEAVGAFDAASPRAGGLSHASQIWSRAMDIGEAWTGMTDALEFAASCIADDPDPQNEREAADGNQYVVRILRAISESALLSFDPARPSFLSMLESVRYLGAAGPDIDYDVAIVEPGVAHRIAGTRGDASYVGIAVYGHAGAAGASGIVASVDLDELVGPDGTFTYEFEHPDAARVIIRQYFHDRASQQSGSWTIERTDGSGHDDRATVVPLPTTAGVAARVANASQSLRWNAQLNRLWSPERRATPNAFVRQTADDIVAAVSNPDVMYAFSWWRLAEGEALVVELVPPETHYWALQLCDRWFQCFPERRSNLNDRQVVPEPDGSVRIVVADGDPGHPNWLDTSGHRLGVMFFRWLHADPDTMPTCRVVPMADVPSL
jgi:hypothetical protein